MRFLEVKSLRFAYGSGPSLLTDVSLSLAKGETGVLLGASGSGKTTFLRCLAGFECPHSGLISVDGRILSSSEVSVPPSARGIGFVFQNLALFPHMTVEDNIRYGLNRVKKSEADDRVEELFTLIELREHRRKYPHQLSGGERQRVALARALAPRPSLILMDEPFSSLDRRLREDLRHEVKAILKATSTTALIVTHDHDEAFVLAEQVGILEKGQLTRWGRREEIFELVDERVPRLRDVGPAQV